MTANTIASNSFSQFDQDGQRFLILQRHHIFAYRQHTDQGGRLFYPYAQWKQEEKRDHQRMVQCKYGISTWNQVKDVKESFPVQLAEYEVLNQITDEPAFA